MVDLEGISESVIGGQMARVKELVSAALAEKAAPQEILNRGLIPAMSVIGSQFEAKEIFLPEVLLAARAMIAGMELLDPLLSAAGVEPIAKVALGSVKGDVHTIGKHLVGVMLKGAGFEVVDLGTDVDPGKFVVAAREGAQLIGMSALTGSTIQMIKPTIEALEEAGVRDRVKVMVGGAIVTQTFADNVGADGYAPDAASAVEKARRLLNLP